MFQRIKADGKLFGLFCGNGVVLMFKLDQESKVRLLLISLRKTDTETLSKM